MVFDFLKLRNSVQDIGIRLNELVNELEQVLKERDEIAAAPTARAELAEALCDWVDRIGRDYPNHLAGVVRNIKDDGPKDTDVPPAILRARASGSGMQIESSALFYLLGDTIKSGLEKAVNEMTYSVEEGLPREQRQHKLQELDGQVAKLKSQLIALQNDADTAGLVIRNAAPMSDRLQRELNMERAS